MTTKGRFNFAYLTNKSGGAVTKGQTVIADSGNDSAFTTSTTAGDTRVIGVVEDASIANNALGLVRLLAGAIAESVPTDATVTRGHFVKQSTTAGKVTDTTTAIGAAVSAPAGSVGVALTGVVGAGNIVVWMFPAFAAAAASNDLFAEIMLAMLPNTDPIDVLIDKDPLYALVYMGSHNAVSWKSPTNAKIVVPGGQTFTVLSTWVSQGVVDDTANRQVRLRDVTNNVDIVPPAGFQGAYQQLFWHWSGDVATPSTFSEIVPASATAELQIWNGNTNKRAIGAVVIGFLQ